MKRRIPIVVMSIIVFLIVFLGIAVRGAAYHSGRSLQPTEANSRTILSSDGPGPQIAFVSDRDENWEVYIMNVDGSQPTNLSEFPQGGGYAWPSTDVKPAWSPDGKRVAFASDRHVNFRVDPDGNRHIYLVNADGSGLVRLTEHPTHDDFPAWSPDGQHIAFCSERDGNWEIYVMNADGSGRTRLTHEPRTDAMPAWSPDGERIAFVSDRDGNGEIYVMKADGSEQTRLTDQWRLDFAPAWSPDGEHIAFVSDRFVSDLLTDVEIYLMKADGSEVTNLTDHKGIDVEPAWSADGTKIAFMSRRDGNAEVYVMNADGSEQVNLTNHPANDFLPSWQPGASGTTSVEAQARVKGHGPWLQQVLGL